MSERLVSALVAVVGSLYVVDLFLVWIGGADSEFADFPSIAGIDTSPTLLSFETGVALVLWEALGLLRAPRTARSNSLVSFFLCAGTGLIGLVGLVHIRWNAPYGYRHPHFAYGAWIAVPLVAGLLTGALMYLVRIRNTPTI